MPILPIFNQAKGPLPLTATFQSPTDSPACLMLAGSAWTQTANTLIGIEVAIDGKVVGTASIFSNMASTHRAVVPSYIPVQLAFGQHKIAITPLNSVTITDYNDFFDLALMY